MVCTAFPIIDMISALPLETYPGKHWQPDAGDQISNLLKADDAKPSPSSSLHTGVLSTEMDWRGQAGGEV